MLFSLLAFLVILTTLILVHEWGHFAAARYFGVRVEEFGLGLPPQATTLYKDKKGTAYTLNYLPLGGFVRMKGEDGGSNLLRNQKDSFSAKPIYQRMIIVCAGVIMNLFLALVLLTANNLIGVQGYAPLASKETLTITNTDAVLTFGDKAGIMITSVLKDTPADKAGIKPGDIITAINNAPLKSGTDFGDTIKASREGAAFTIERRSLPLTLTIVPNAEGKIGVGYAGSLLVPFTKTYSLSPAITHAVVDTGRFTVLILASLGDLAQSLIIEQRLPDDIGGPVAIARETYYRGDNIALLLNFAALISLSLAVFNILPIPALDGGRLLFLFFEAVRGKPISPAIEARIHASGFLLLIALIAVVTYHDILG